MSWHYGSTTSSEITTGRPAVTGVGTPPEGSVVPIGIVAPIDAPAHGSQHGFALAAHGAFCPHVRIGGAVTGAGAPGGVNPGGR